MNKVGFKRYALWVLFCEAVGALSGFLTRSGMRIYEQSVDKPPLTPPGIVFPIVWGILFALMGIGAARVSVQGERSMRRAALTVFFVQLFFNFFWSIIFFNFQTFGLAFIWLLLLLALVVLMIVLFARVDKAAALLQLPYLLWVGFALYLNFGVWRLNG
ncbi:MAG: tryptophan-rich sensory protein [Oscillospiraceae bacterium]|nr:tryptophan-rich sensory protein [Oscillospiraceae bacterium]